MSGDPAKSGTKSSGIAVALALGAMLGVLIGAAAYFLSVPLQQVSLNRTILHVAIGGLLGAGAGGAVGVVLAACRAKR